MNQMCDTLPGIERIRTRFLSLLQERQTAIAQNALAAWESDDRVEQHNHLLAVQNVMHQISGSAGSLGFSTLGDSAQECENSIITFLSKGDENLRQVPCDLMTKIDDFVCSSQALVACNGNPPSFDGAKP